MVEYAEKKIDSISFGLFSPKEIKKISVTKIITPELYDREGYPVDGGLMDIRLGVIDPGLRCKTCGGKLKECMGHFGHIELARPVMHVLFVDMLYDILRGTCRGCYKILLDEPTAVKYYDMIVNFDKDKNLDVRRKLTKKLINKTRLIKKCPHCQEKQYPVKLEKPTTFNINDSF